MKLPKKANRLSVELLEKFGSFYKIEKLKHCEIVSEIF